ncbi:uncharacterized protein SPSK_06818 [Sporothrix schenckii 1099-18]|uniref:Uncharacterized protein n=1 Tax=Sporothrix schenckii 1099-18 TaxID=1397361 RepID=A0A0F2MJR9_SPOSC|nr:uncharacterized protein SPSK_06818 [Sporothrix schenckii 1099-18]KJR89319.1 hypothetical protein SPSK_06818 [Sporothrix schenckii 1099-18]
MSDEVALNDREPERAIGELELEFDGAEKKVPRDLEAIETFKCDMGDARVKFIEAVTLSPKLNATRYSCAVG